MKILSRALKVTLTILVALFFSAVIFGMLSATQAYFASFTMFAPMEIFQLVTTAVFTFGVVPALIFGTPVYLALQHYKIANWFTVSLAGIIPGLIALFSSLDFGIYCIIIGGFIALSTHYFWRSRI
jgi:hypothetical protein